MIIQALKVVLEEAELAALHDEAETGLRGE